MDALEAWLQARLSELESRSQLRRSTRADRDDLIVACSNDYLSIAAEPVSRETLEQCSRRTGAGASRLVSGDSVEVRELEAEVAAWLGTETALVFTSGYAANVGALSALAGRDAVVFSDALNHASIVDGCRLGRARIEVIEHRSLESLEARLRATDAANRWVVVEGVYSMDGDSWDLAELQALCEREGAFLYVDEAHALGVRGPEGRGALAAAGARADVVIGTLGKSVGAQGAFVAGSARLRELLWNRARSLVFSTGFSPLLAALCTHRVRQVRQAEKKRVHLQQLCGRFRSRAAELRLAIPEAPGPIFPVLLGAERLALQAASDLEQHGFRVAAIRPPTVPPGTSRLRVSLSAAWSPRLVDDLAEALARVGATW